VGRDERGSDAEAEAHDLARREGASLPEQGGERAARRVLEHERGSRAGGEHLVQPDDVGVVERAEDLGLSAGGVAGAVEELDRDDVVRRAAAMASRSAATSSARRRSATSCSSNRSRCGPRQPSCAVVTNRRRSAATSSSRRAARR
jgi:hypothetical protein